MVVSKEVKKLPTLGVGHLPVTPPPKKWLDHSHSTPPSQSERKTILTKSIKEKIDSATFHNSRMTKQFRKTSEKILILYLQLSTTMCNMPKKN